MSDVAFQFFDVCFDRARRSSRLQVSFLAGCDERSRSLCCCVVPSWLIDGWMDLF